MQASGCGYNFPKGDKHKLIDPLHAVSGHQIRTKHGMAKRLIHPVVCLTTCRPDYCDTSLKVRAPRLRVKQGRCIRCSYPIQDLFLSRHLRTDAKEKPGT
jgi:hypothetical protein